MDAPLLWGCFELADLIIGHIRQIRQIGNCFVIFWDKAPVMWEGAYMDAPLLWGCFELADLIIGHICPIRQIGNCFAIFGNNAPFMLRNFWKC
jgi:hypothetical protein